jgi:hypothetical protein
MGDLREVLPNRYRGDAVPKHGAREAGYSRNVGELGFGHSRRVADGVGWPFHTPSGGSHRVGLARGGPQKVSRAARGDWARSGLDLLAATARLGRSEDLQDYDGHHWPPLWLKVRASAVLRGPCKRRAWSRRRPTMHVAQARPREHERAPELLLLFASSWVGGSRTTANLSSAIGPVKFSASSQKPQVAC